MVFAFVFHVLFFFSEFIVSPCFLFLSYQFQDLFHLYFSSYQSQLHSCLFLSFIWFSVLSQFSLSHCFPTFNVPVIRSTHSPVFNPLSCSHLLIRLPTVFKRRCQLTGFPCWGVFLFMQSDTVRFCYFLDFCFSQAQFYGVPAWLRFLLQFEITQFKFYCQHLVVIHVCIWAFLLSSSPTMTIFNF